MSFQTGLSGLNASGKRLDVIGNNIANANTVGMKVSRVEFNELVASALGPSGGGGAGGGIGVAVGAVSQQFSQGTINITGNSLDVAINGGGFYQITQKDGSPAYTRDGQFKLTNTGAIVTNSGANLMGYPTTLLGVTTSTTIQKLTVPTGAPIPAKATTAVSAEFNLDSRAAIAATATPPVPIGTYGTTLTGYDSQGVPVPIDLYFTKVGADKWDIYMPDPLSTTTTPLPPKAVTGLNAVPPSPSVSFDINGKITAPLTPIDIKLYSQNPNVNLASTPPGQFTATLDIKTASQYGTPFAVSSLTQDGYTAGNLTAVTINDQGVLTTQYSNGQTQARGKISLADFRNVQGLVPIGAGAWTESAASGQPIQGSPGTGNFGKLRSGATEDSNVDLTAQLIDMMTAQRDYQANAQTIKTQDQTLSTLVNLR
ncbi:flagellar hook protein FlgE [Rhodoferax aquaticus]|uniref:Flagellar hook protein FlgE n=1 Tax=Rhodoferax aquaticus TaxID=2527691 RepID=A0A515ETY3_9BURK|nr:flagellar hook protein FlgE [Rhodoferax aquaticus]QDL56111.1 flagellar hook protein FlgE [Rhodoferax aquaticus]